MCRKTDSDKMIFKSSFSIEEIEENFKDVDYFESIIAALNEVTYYEKDK